MSRALRDFASDSCVDPGGTGVCRIEVSSQAFRSADGTVATVAATAFDTTWDVEILNEPEANCDGEMIPIQTKIWRMWRAEPTSPETSRLTMTFDDGGALELFVDSLTTVFDTCAEMVGPWEGVEGAFKGRVGTYRWIDDGLQDELVLTES